MVSAFFPNPPKNSIKVTITNAGPKFGQVLRAIGKTILIPGRMVVCWENQRMGGEQRRLFRKWKQSYIYIYCIYIYLYKYIIFHLIWEGWNTNQKSTSVLQHLIYIGGIEYQKNNHVCFPFFCS